MWLLLDAIFSQLNLISVSKPFSVILLIWLFLESSKSDSKHINKYGVHTWISMKLMDHVKNISNLWKWKSYTAWFWFSWKPTALTEFQANSFNQHALYGQKFMDTRPSHPYMSLGSAHYCIGCLYIPQHYNFPSPERRATNMF